MKLSNIENAEISGERIEKMKVFVTPRGFAKCGLENEKIFADAGICVSCNKTGKPYTKEEFYRVTEGADGVIVGVETVDKAYIDSHPTLKAVVKFGVGLDNIDVQYCREKGIFVGKTAGSNAQSVAETAISFILADSKNLYHSLQDTKTGGWNKQTGYEIEGKTVGIVGFGAIGKKVAKMANGLGMQVLAYDPYAIDQEAVTAYSVTVIALDKLLQSADFISLHLPLTEETRDLIALPQLKTMKPQAVLINTARGGIVNEADLFRALSEKTIRAAYFDVLENEPPKADEPLLTLDNFYLTPHIASRSAEAEQKTAAMATQVMIEALTK